MTETCHAPRGTQDILFPVLAVLRTLQRPVTGPPPPRSGRTYPPSIDKRTYAGILIFGTHNMLKPQTPRDGGVRQATALLTFLRVEGGSFRMGEAAPAFVGRR
jgi:hypothetical protein